VVGVGRGATLAQVPVALLDSPGGNRRAPAIRLQPGAIPLPGATGQVDLHIMNPGHGFQLTVPSGRTVRTLRRNVGEQAAQVRLVARLSDGRARVCTGTSSANATGTVVPRTYTLTFAAASSQQTLTLRYMMQANHGDAMCLLGATLKCVRRLQP
jgi:hypothetical protein